MSRLRSFRRAAAMSVVTVATVAAAPMAVYGANNTDLTQVINAGILSMSILDQNRADVAAPAVGMSAKAFSFECQNGADASTGVLGTNTERLYVTNPDGADNGWTLSIGATDGVNAVWENPGQTSSFDFNDASAAGCTDGDGDAVAGQLSVDPTTNGVVSTDCQSCTTTGVSTGSAAAFDSGNSVTLLNAAGVSDDVWQGYLTDIDLEQSIPAETPTDSYSLNTTVTVLAQ